MKQAEYGGVVALSAAGVEDDLGLAAVEHPCEGFAGVIDGAMRSLPVHVNRGCVAEVLHPIRTDGFHHLWKQRRSGIGIHVYAGHGNQQSCIDCTEERVFSPGKEARKGVLQAQLL